VLGWDVSGAVEAVGYGVTLYRTGDEVFGLIGHDYLTKAPQVLKPGGILVSTLPHSIPEVAAEATAKGLRPAGLFVEADRLGMTALADLAALMPTIAATFPLDRAGEAQSYRPGSGKVVLTV
jgi:NADPH:quinone reductase-like Zn-dependent oxidoreductase